MSLAVLRRIEAISATSRDIMRGDLGRRIVLRGSGDEFDHLSASLNAMLDRIQALMAGLQQVSSDVAHDLRTPLTRLRQRLELARRREHQAADLPAAVDDAIIQLDAILGTFTALLRIARSRPEAAGPPSPRWTCRHSCSTCSRPTSLRPSSAGRHCGPRWRPAWSCGATAGC